MSVSEIINKSNVKTFMLSIWHCHRKQFTCFVDFHKLTYSGTPQQKIEICMYLFIRLMTIICRYIKFIEIYVSYQGERHAGGEGKPIPDWGNSLLLRL